jgi:hypothetical protein
VQVGPPPPEVRFLGALADALRALQSVDRVALGGIDASRISFGDGAADTIAESTDEGIVIHRSHPAVRIALRSFESDRGILAFILSAIYTAHNIRSAAIGEADEVVFQGVLAAAGSERSARGPAEPEGHPR